MIEYTVEYKKVKNITLRILPDGSLSVTAPKQTGRAMIEQVISQKRSWITSHQQKTEQRKQERMRCGLVNQYCDGGQIAYLGKQYPLAVKESGKRGWHWDGAHLLLSGCAAEESCRQLVENFYRHQMRNEIIPMLNREVRLRMEHLSVPESEFAVRKMRASWGICYSQKQKIVLNLWLAMAPAECIRQVMVHEYVHFLHNNHAPEFYALLEQLEPQYRQLKHTLSIMVDIKGGTL